jgi:hypothetical protein
MRPDVMAAASIECGEKAMATEKECENEAMKWNNGIAGTMTKATK